MVIKYLSIDQAQGEQEMLCVELNKTLADYATPYKVDHRLSTITKDPGRSSFQRDRDRIIHSRSFRRLDKKTQAFPLFESDHARTRMTHTLEVFQIADSVARRLRLNTDLAASIAFGHDLGHTPFGHAGERALNNIAIAFNKTGFKHNYQSLKILTELEGNMKLTIETRDGILQHTSLFYNKNKLERDTRQMVVDDKLNIPLLYFDSELEELYIQLSRQHSRLNQFSFSLEGQVVAIADEIAQKEHDTDDAIRFGLVEVKDIIKKFRETAPASAQHFSEFLKSIDESIVKKEKEDVKNIFISYLTGVFIDDVCNNFKVPVFYEFIHPIYGIIKVAKEKAVNFSPHGEELFKFLDEYLRVKYLQNYRIKRLDARAGYLIEQLFKAFWVNPEQMHEKTYNSFLLAQDSCKEKKENCIFELTTSFKEIKKIHSKLCSKECFPLKVILNTISGMTDYYFYKEYQSLYFPPKIL